MRGATMKFTYIPTLLTDIENPDYIIHSISQKVRL